MYYNLGDNIYALHVVDERQEVRIVNGEINAFHDCVDKRLKFYYYETILLKFKNSIDNNNNKISERSIVGYLDIFCDKKSYSYNILSPYIPNLSREFVDINNGSCYPIGIISMDKCLLLKYFNFLKDIFEIENSKDIYAFIKKNFR